MKILITLSVPDDTMVIKDHLHHYVNEMANKLDLTVDSVFEVEPISD